MDIDGTMFFLVYGERSSDASFHDYMSLLVKQPQATVLLDSFNVFRGNLIAGGLAELRESDDSYLQVQPGFTLNSNEPPVWVEFSGTATDDAPANLSFLIEGNANTVNLNQTIELFNFNSGSYEEIDSRDATIVDSVTQVTPGGDVTRFVQGGSGMIKARVGWKATGFVLLYPWTISVDHVAWDLNP